MNPHVVTVNLSRSSPQKQPPGSWSTTLGNTQKLGIEADTVDDNIFQWNVKMRNFLGTPLDDDLKKIEQKYGYHYIELQLDFSKD